MYATEANGDVASVLLAGEDFNRGLVLGLTLRGRST